MGTDYTSERWHVGGGTGMLNQVQIEPAIGCVYGAGKDVKDRARLIAAAPTLLKACRLAIGALKGREHDGFLRDAIEVATGERP